jgi:hypothetical protein|nr:MAG TPA: hypothetical protein [Inoviridae sp.]
MKLVARVLLLLLCVSTIRAAFVISADGETTNLIPFPYAEASTTKNGVTFTVDELDGSVTLSGISTSSMSFSLTSPTFFLSVGTYFFSLNSDKVLSNSTIFGVVNKYQHGDFVGDVAVDYGNGASFSVSSSDSSSNVGYSIEIFVRGANINCDGYVFHPVLNEEAQNTYTLQSFLQALSGIDFDFSSVLWTIAEIGNAAQSIGSGGFIEGLLGTLKTIGLAITFPVSLVADLLSFVYSVSVFVFSLLGFSPA